MSSTSSDNESDMHENQFTEAYKKEFLSMIATSDDKTIAKLSQGVF